MDANRHHLQNAPAIRKKWFPFLSFVVVLASVGVQIECLYNGFVTDDHLLVFNAEVRGCGYNPLDCFRNKVLHFYYRPILPASFALVQRLHLHDNSPEWFHLENLVLHATVAALGLWLFRLLLRRRTAALIAGALFALHPIQVCITSFIGGRTDSLALLFVFLFAIGLRLGSSLLRVSYRGGCTHYRTAAFIWIVVSLLALTAAAFSKEQVIGLALLTPLLAMRREGTLVTGRSKARGADDITGRSWRLLRCASSRLWLGLYAVPVALYGIACRTVLKGQHIPDAGWTPILHIELVGRTIWYFVKIFLFPGYSTLHPSTLGSWDVSQPFVEMMGYVAALAWFYAVWWLWRNRACRVMALWTTLTLIPCLNLVPTPSALTAPFRAALPLFGLAGVTGYLLEGCTYSLRRRLRAPGMLVLPILGWYVYASAADVPIWANDLSLMSAAVDADPNNNSARSAMASLWLHPPDGSQPSNSKSLQQFNVCIDQLFGAGTPTERYPDIAQSPEMARKLHSMSFSRNVAADYIPPLFYARGTILWNIGRYDDAIRDYRVLHRLVKPNDHQVAALAESYRAAGIGLMLHHQFSGAAQCFRAGVELESEDMSMRRALIQAYRSAGLTAKAHSVETDTSNAHAQNP